MSFLQNTYLYRLFKTDKLLFTLLSVYALGIAYYALRQREEFPFLLFGMYSLKEEPQRTYITYNISINDKPIKYSDLWEAEEEVITGPVYHAISLKNAGKITDSEMQQLLEWLLRYCKDMRREGENHIDIEKLTCAFDASGRPQVLGKENYLHYVAK